MTFHRSLLDAARDGFRPPERLGVAEWAERHVRLAPKVTNHPGPFRLALTPYLTGIFDAFRDPSIETVYLCWAAQTAKTTGELLCLLWTIDQDPGPALWAMPTETLARSFSQERLQPLIDETPELVAQKPADSDRYKTLEMQMRGATIALVGGNSPASLSSRPIRYLFVDEVDKLPAESIREGSALNLAIRRTAHFWNRKIVISSTPTLADGQIWRGLLSGDWRQYWIPCPKCGEMQTLALAQIRKPEGVRHPDKIRESAWYECPHCKGRVEDADKPAMLAAGEWRARQTPAPEFDWKPPPAGGRIASLHLPSWYAPWTAFGEALARFTAAAHAPEVLREVVNSDLAEPWEERGEAKSEVEVLAHRSEYPPGVIPAGSRVAAIIQTIDVQDVELYYAVRAWGLNSESWLVAYGVLDDFGAADITLERSYSGIPVASCLVDSGGHRTGEVYEWCRARGAVPLKGVDTQTQPARWSPLDRMPDGKPIPAGLRLLTIHSAHFKGLLFRRMAIKRGDPGYWHLHGETGDDYARQICAEVLVERRDGRGRVTKLWKQVRRDNHYLDCEVYQLAAAHVLGVRYATEKQCWVASNDVAPETTTAGLSAEGSPKADRPPKNRRPDPWKATRFKI